MQISPDEMIDELTRQCGQLQLQLAAANILIRKLQEQVDGTSIEQEEERSLNGSVRHPIPEEVSHQ